MTRGRPRKEPDVVPDTKEQLVAVYLSKFVCMIPGCDPKGHYADAINIVKIVENEVNRLHA